jgi:hypothetical protein
MRHRALPLPTGTISAHTARVICTLLVPAPFHAAMTPVFSTVFSIT